ncbi:MAG: AAA family ATPase [Acidobacteria bacterium]|nr:AAA family ATPase [Acidobacteriota bacterium]MYJ02975.1 AAA family ATPase [Acidobacteriota bacterium]
MSESATISPGIRQRSSPEHALDELSGLLDILSGRRVASVWIPFSVLNQASELRSRTLSDWSWLWRQPGHYLRLWWAGRDLTNQRRDAHNRRASSLLASDPALAHLNEAQRHAVGNLDDRVFVTAGAGSGKTRVIVEKVRHVVRTGAARPDEIAVITFTNKATEEVRGRLRGLDGVTVETIHRLAMQVIKQQGLQPPRISQLAEDRSTHRRLALMSQWLDETLAEKPELLLEVYERAEAFRRHHGAGGAAPLPLVPPGGTEVKSLGEARIALTLYSCGIAYQYETELVVPEQLSTDAGRRYHPDFFIPDDPDEKNPPPEAGIWLEHYSHDRHGNLPPEYLEKDGDAHRRYNEDREWKRSVFAAMRLRYVETSYGDIEHARAGGEGFSHLLVRRLNAHRRTPIPTPDPRSVDTLLRTVVDSKGKGARRMARELDAWIRAWRQSSNRRPPMAPPGLGRDGRSAARALERLARPVMARWEQHLQKNNKEDFEA